MKKIGLLLFFLSLIFIYHYLFNSDDYQEVNLPRWAVAAINTAISFGILFMFFIGLLRKSRIHIWLSIKMFDRWKKNYEHESQNIILSNISWTQFSSIIPESLVRLGFTELKKLEGRYIFHKTDYPSYIIDIQKDKSLGHFKLNVFPFCFYSAKERSENPINELVLLIKENAISEKLSSSHK